VNNSATHNSSSLSPRAEVSKAELLLQDGSRFSGESFGSRCSTAGEVVFNTGMVGYPEAMTDPSYRGQILVLTYPLIGNYGVPVNEETKPSENDLDISEFFESSRIQISGLIIATLSKHYRHCSALGSLASWMQRQNIPGICNIDTRMLTKKLRNQGMMLGKIVVDDTDFAWEDPNERNLVAEASLERPRFYPGSGQKKVILVDFGCKESILRHLLSKRLDVLRVPWNYDWSEEIVDGVVLSNGPGDPKMCGNALKVLRKGLERDIPILGICLGHQLLALAVGADTFKLKYGHRSQNQPCIQVGTKRCYITSQNHGFAVNEKTLPQEWKPWFFNANDGTNEGMRHRERPIFSVQFHPEANPGPTEASFVFDSFLDALDHG
jgi:carbamoyl-phosphate synthase small subunit